MERRQVSNHSVNKESGRRYFYLASWYRFRRRLHTVLAVASPSGRRDAAAGATLQQKADFLICCLDEAAHEKIEELSQQERCDFNTIVAHLKQVFEGRQHRYMARQALSARQQQTGESSATFANRLLNLVGAATTGQDPSSQKERVLEEFVAGCVLTFATTSS
ncbi:hypothetical protein RB195_014476 [Necator americanus]|uniref:Uncharacterized protein n=1 Tax=Necator americanus TaxID=51031 RepID=A0ABR1E0R2_NECAM